MLWNRVETSRDRQKWNWNVNHLIAFVIGRVLLLRFLEATKHCKNENFPRQLDLVRYVAILRRFDSAIGLELAEQQQQQISNDDGRLLEVKQLEEGCLIKIDVVVFALNEESDKFFIIKSLYFFKSIGYIGTKYVRIISIFLTLRMPQYLR